jgi:hypothetical protein
MTQSGSTTMAEPNTQRSCFLAQCADGTFHQP